MVRTSYGVCLRAFAPRRSIDPHRCWNVSICRATRLAALDEGWKKYVDGKRKPSTLRRFRNGLNDGRSFRGAGRGGIARAAQPRRDTALPDRDLPHLRGPVGHLPGRPALREDDLQLRLRRGGSRRRGEPRGDNCQEEQETAHTRQGSGELVTDCYLAGATLRGRCPRSAHPAARSRLSGTTGAIRWWPPAAGSTRTSRRCAS